eukprot:CAMPEP_0201281790 /NCGR_PEP_ID=MMETSP1317-20130820/4055_1 /ASSEMBLY_ACC=CAM_ASM_000770 /TAXON_ID=187299 /ORGANISM="Undescribed Undescribed, Strain Undescribed" /LENGTH=55 /DNA_ID=CAMNT_0047592657 /DNA_START=23 /DNA_END=190 /DNA_ORIENTATION=+
MSDPIDEAMIAIQEFWLGDSPDAGEALFNKFAGNWAHAFPEDIDPTAEEQKPELL